MLKGFKKIAVPENVKLVASAVEDEPQVVTVAPESHTCDHDGDDCDCPVAVPASTVAGPHYPELSEKFLLAGRALFTVSNPKGDHYTFRVKKAESEWPVGSGRMSTSYFVSVKAPGGDYPYRYIGMLLLDKKILKTTNKSAFLPGSKEYEVAAWACFAVLDQKMIPDGYHIEHAGRCGKCGRTLTDPESIQRGIGPECWSTLK
jgi:hypothetical protein